MSALPIIITSAGLAALVNAANTGTEAVVITQVGISATTFAPTEATTAIPGEIKRLATIAGVVVSDDTLHIAVSDTSADAYTLRSFGLYLDSGVLLAVYSSAASIAEKAAPATLLLNADIKLTSPLAGAIEFGDSSFANPPASETVVGVLRLATEPEALAGINGTRAITPVTMKSTILAHLTAYAATVAAALAGKAAVGHSHVASDIASGTFDVARIPDLAIAKITGLVASLAAKANAVHTHALADVTGLVAALSDKSPAGHTHDAGDTVSGIFDVARVPDLVMSKITGLAAALAAKANSAHSHAMADVTGLTAALALKLDSAAFTWANLAKPDVVINGQSSVTARGATGNGYALIAGGNADLTGIIGFYIGDGTRVGWIGQAHKVNRRISFTTENGGSFGFDQRPDFAGATPWDTANFNPADKAAAVHSHDWAQVTGSRASAADFRSNTSDRALTPNGVWAAAELVAAAQAATIAVDMSSALNFTTVMTGNRTLGAPANAKPGQSGVIQLIQDGTGGRTLAFNAAWKFASGIDPILSTAAGARDLLCFTVLAADDVVASLIKDVR